MPCSRVLLQNAKAGGSLFVSGEWGLGLIRNEMGNALLALFLGLSGLCGQADTPSRRKHAKTTV